MGLFNCCFFCNYKLQVMSEKLAKQHIYNTNISLYINKITFILYITCFTI